MNFSIEEGIVRSDNWTDQPPDWTITVCGDWAPKDQQIDVIRHDPHQLYGGLLPILKASDLLAVNLECVLEPSSPPIIKDGPPVKAPHDVVNGLTCLPHHLICLANNHSMDFGARGLEATCSILSQNRLPHIGAGATLQEAREPFCTQVGTTRVGILNIAEGEEGISKNGGAGVASMDLSCVEKQIAELRHNNDLVIVIAHAGREVVPVPPPYIQAAYRSLIDAGADAVVAHHPHVPQGIEIYRDKLIVYSLGNFVFSYGGTYGSGFLWSSVGYVIRIHLAGTHIHHAEIVPYSIHADRLEPLQGQERLNFMRELNTFSTFLTNPEQYYALWDAFTDLWIQHQMTNEMVEMMAALLPASELARAAEMNLNSSSGLNGRLARRAFRLLRRWVNRTTPADLPGRNQHQQHEIARLRNRFDTLAHRELYINICNRIMTGQIGTAPAWATDLLMKWYNSKQL